MSNSQGPTAKQRRKRRDILASAPPIEGWSAPRNEDVPQADQEAYYANKLAVEMWAKGSTETAIIEATRLSAADARRLAQRCITLNKKTKTVHGFWACMPNRRLEQVGHKRRNAFDADLAKEGKGREGKYALSWRPTDCVVCVGQTGRDAAALPILTSESELASEIAKAAALCRCRTDNPKRRSWKRYRDATSTGDNAKITASTSLQFPDPR